MNPRAILEVADAKQITEAIKAYERDVLRETTWHA
jgi:hypothetical protein